MKHFGDNWKVYGPDVDQIFEVPQNHLKSIAKGQGTLIRIWNNINPPKNLEIQLKFRKQPKLA